MDLLGSSLVRHMFFHIGAFYDKIMSTFSSKPRKFSWLRRHRKVGETIFLQPVSRRSSSPSYCLSSSMLKADDWPRHAGRDTFSVAGYEFPGACDLPSVFVTTCAIRAKHFLQVQYVLYLARCM